MTLIDLANPTRFLALTRAAAAVARRRDRDPARDRPLSRLLAPDDYQQGETVRIMYIHVPSAWLSMLSGA